MSEPERLSDPQVIGDPYGFYRRLRREGPVVWSPTLFGGAWLVFDMALVQELFADWPRLTSQRSREIVDLLGEEDRSRFSTLVELHSQWMVFHDPPEHTRLRKVMTRGFASGILKRLRPQLDAHVDELIASFAGRGRVDVVAELAAEVPLWTVATLLGIPPEDRGQFLRWTADIAAYVGLEEPTPSVLEAAQRSISAFAESFRERIAERRRRPREHDMLSALIQTGDEATLGELEIAAQSALLAFAGNETTKNLIANTILCLLERPDQRRRVGASPDRVAAAVEETLRFECPVQFIGRKVKDDFELGGAQLERGQSVVLMVGAANRDPQANADPDRFDVDRAVRRHVSFGNGPHACLGQALARLEAQVAVGRFLERCADPRLEAHRPVWRNNPGLRGLERLDVVFRVPAARRGAPRAADPPSGPEPPP